jgi:hypothetical protein
MSTPSDEPAPSDDASDPQARRALHRSSWFERLGPYLTDEWQSVETIASRIGEPRHTVLARLKDMAEAELAERRIVQLAKTSPAKKKKARRPKIHTAQFEAQFRRRERAG